ncbi:MAG: (d)CMP kinase [Thermacetogeniaceae bacterium]|nr:(d)CMP kinase [Thermoanaerobacterales bacterium]NLN20417.1 (d)CMP kinase [Syntrophomonadaceae bacterium]HAF17126.1 (d)CMP kinase [Peptococcaceae bacterium]
MPRRANIAIDGPAGSGKSTVARILAQRIGYLYIDTGAMYRAVTFFALRKGINLYDDQELASLAKKMKFSLVRNLHDGTVTLWCDGEDVSPYLREREVSERVSRVAEVAGVREHLVKYQRNFARVGGVVMEGRDIGTVVLPDAEYKFFLTASIDVRVERRRKELEAAKKTIASEELYREMTYRDEMDSKREIGPLVIPSDAVVIDSTTMTIEQVIEKIIEICGGGLRSVL